MNEGNTDLPKAHCMESLLLMPLLDNFEVVFSASCVSISTAERIESTEEWGTGHSTEPNQTRGCMVWILILLFKIGSGYYSGNF